MDALAYGSSLLLHSGEDTMVWTSKSGSSLWVKRAGQRAMHVPGDEHDILDAPGADGFQQAQTLFGKGFPGVIAVAFAIGIEHHAGDHELDPRCAVAQPFEQGLFLCLVEDASIIG